MPKNDFLSGITISLFICISLIPTLFVNNLYAQIPLPPYLIFLTLPIIILVGLFIAFQLSKVAKIIWQIAKFGLVGISNTAIDFGILNILILLTGTVAGVGIILINAISFTGALLNSYYWNKTWVFNGSKKSNFLGFLIVTIIGMVLNTGIVFMGSTYIQPIGNLSSTQWTNLAKVIATGVSLLWNFAGYKLIVFKK